MPTTSNNKNIEIERLIDLIQNLIENEDELYASAVLPSKHDLDIFIVWSELPFFETLKLKRTIKFIDKIQNLRNEMSLKFDIIPHNFLKIPFKRCVNYSNRFSCPPIHLLAYETLDVLYSWERLHIAESLLSHTSVNLSRINIDKKRSFQLYSSKIFHILQYLYMSYVSIGVYSEESDFLKDFAHYNIRYSFLHLRHLPDQPISKEKIVQLIESQIYNYTRLEKISEQDIKNVAKIILSDDCSKISCKEIRDNFPLIINIFAQVVEKLTDDNSTNFLFSNS